jgi:UDP:flavonoid glycosyltransferase YjiC (YdhE family)
MKIMVVAVPASGHVNPLLPLVRAFLRAGHEVAVAAGDDPGGVIATAGATHLQVGQGMAAWFDTLRARVRGVPGDGLAPERIDYYFIPRLFADIGAVDMIDDLVTAGRAFGPDVIVFETYALAAPLAAEILGVPAVHHLISPMSPHDVFELVDDALSPLWRSFDRETPGWAGVYHGITIEVTPASLEPLALPDGRGMGLRPTELPLRPREHTERPLVYLTLGTVFSGNTHVFQSALDGLAEHDVDVVVTVGADNDPRVLTDVPRNTRVERFIPQAELLPRCAVVVHHGGSGTMFGAMAHGVPQVVIPQGADNFRNAEYVARAGIGLSILPDELEAAAVRRAVGELLADSGYAERAATVAGEIEAMPSADQLVQDILATLHV